MITIRRTTVLIVRRKRRRERKPKGDRQQQPKEKAPKSVEGLSAQEINARKLQSLADKQWNAFANNECTRKQAEKATKKK